ncbi:MAG TPA: bifunctional diaminohydroxyphosphoribosylaminopyrimidine deaminase/5-amino-6-(5-phosphoribosylamino)uracil reductase RibD [Polyangia bacterium]
MTAPLDAADIRFMRRALALARRGAGTTKPNPMVGAVVVRRGRILAEGFHRRPGQAHAEVEALARLGGRAPGATIYVSLEPCAHTGRTPPCTTALLAAGVARVVVGVRDPNPLVDGQGIARLRRGGVQVDVGCLEDECRDLNRAFFTWVSQKRPLVTLKVAATWDGFIADRRERKVVAPAWLTGPEARAAAQGMRAAHDAVLVGATTVRDDDPLLTDRRPPRRGRTKRARQPLRVVLDGRLSISPRARLVTSAAETPTLVVGARGAAVARVKALTNAGAEVALLPARAGRVPIRALLAHLAARDVQSLLVEGGAEIHGAFIAAGLVDRVAFFLAPRLLGGGLSIAAGPGRPVANALVLGQSRLRRLGSDLLIEADVIPA